MQVSTGVARLLGLGAVLATLPIIENCGPKPAEFAGRGAYMINKDPGTATADFKDPADKRGEMLANIERTPTSLTVKTEDGTIHDLENVPSGGPGYYSGDGMYAFVTEVPDVDEDGTPDDTFLVFTGNNPNGPQNTEYSVAYQGTAASAETIARLKGYGGHSATYTGKGTSSFSGAIGNDYINKTGNTAVTVNFGDGLVDGELSNMAGGPALVQNFDTITFIGSLDSATENSPDINLTNVVLLNGSTVVANLSPNSGGFATLFGPNAGGIIGALSGAGALASDGTVNVNLLGTFWGSTTDNNPAP